MKTIKINDQPVTLSFSPYSLILYKQQFGVEPLDVVIGPLYNLCSILDQIVETGEVSAETLVAITSKISEAGHINLYGILWSFIKTADPKTPDFASWLKDQYEMPILDILFEIAPDFISSMVTKKKVNPPAVLAVMKSLAQR